MNKIILIYVVLLTVYSCEATNSSEPNKDVNCPTPYSGNSDGVFCGTDARDYYYRSTFECVRKNSYGRRINLQIKHRGRCWIWEKYGYKTYLVICVSKFEVHLILIEYRSLVFLFYFISLQISIIIIAVVFGVYMYYTGAFWTNKECTCALKNSTIDGPHDSNRCEKMIEVKINLHVESQDGRITFRHDPIIIDKVQLELIPAALPITIDE